MKLPEFKSLVVDAKVIVVKVGSSLVTNDGNGLDQAAIAGWASQIPLPLTRQRQLRRCNKTPDKPPRAQMN